MFHHMLVHFTPEFRRKLVLFLHVTALNDMLCRYQM